MGQRPERRAKNEPGYGIVITACAGVFFLHEHALACTYLDSHLFLLAMLSLQRILDYCFGTWDLLTT